MPSDDYRRAVSLMQEFHRKRKTFSGSGCLKHRTALVKFSREIGAASGIDYGCGKGLQYDLDFTGGYSLVHELGYQPFRFDPGVPKFGEPPAKPADLVFCVDVLECVPEADVPWALSEIVRFAKRGVFITVASYPSKKKLPDGSNAHLTIRPWEWWTERFQAALKGRDLRSVLLVA